jgi:toxin ParE1/3/4
MYEIRYLPIARRDLIDIINYIMNHLKAPKAASNLLDEIEKSILLLGEFPFSCRVYQLSRNLKTEYRLLSVKNYAIFYVVEESKIEIHRIIYAKMDLNKVIKD